MPVADLDGLIQTLFNGIPQPQVQSYNAVMTAKPLAANILYNTPHNLHACGFVLRRGPWASTFVPAGVWRVCRWLMLGATHALAHGLGATSKPKPDGPCRTDIYFGECWSTSQYTKLAALEMASVPNMLHVHEGCVCKTSHAGLAVSIPTYTIAIDEHKYRSGIYKSGINWTKSYGSDMLGIWLVQPSQSWYKSCYLVVILAQILLFGVGFRWYSVIWCLPWIRIPYRPYRLSIVGFYVRRICNYFLLRHFCTVYRW